MTKAKITAKVQNGILTTTSQKTAQLAKNTQGVQHIGSFGFKIVNGEFVELDKPSHIFAKQVKA